MEALAKQMQSWLWLCADDPYDPYAVVKEDGVQIEIADPKYEGYAQVEEYQDVAPPSLVGHFQISLDAGGESLGVRMEATVVGLLVLAVGSGPLKTHNVCSSDEAYVYRHDLIVKVSGRSEVRAMMAEIGATSELCLEMVHPKRFEAIIDTRITPLGLDVDTWDKNSTVLEIQKISEDGAASCFNQAHPPEERVEAQDLIVDVNGVFGDRVKMLAELKSGRSLRVGLLRVKDLRPTSVAPVVSARENEEPKLG